MLEVQKLQLVSSYDYIIVNIYVNKQRTFFILFKYC